MKAVGLAIAAAGALVYWVTGRILMILSAAMLAMMPVVGGVQAQSLGDKFGGFSTTSNEPINIEADQLNVNDLKKTAIFSGNVRAVQGDFELRSKTLEVFYVGGAANQQSSSGKVKRLAAKGTVLITTKDSQSATSQWANFDVLKQTIVLGDQVVLTQGGNIIKGGRLFIDLKTRQSRFINKTQKGRIQMKVDVNPKKKK